MFAELLLLRRAGRACLALALVLPSSSGWASAYAMACVPVSPSRVCDHCLELPPVGASALNCNGAESQPMQIPPALPANVEMDGNDTLERSSDNLSMAQPVCAVTIPTPRHVELASRDAHTAIAATSADRCAALSRWII